MATQCIHCTGYIEPDDFYDIELCEECEADPAIAKLYEVDLMSEDDQWQVRVLEGNENE